MVWFLIWIQLPRLPRISFYICLSPFFFYFFFSQAAHRISFYVSFSLFLSLLQFVWAFSSFSLKFFLADVFILFLFDPHLLFSSIFSLIPLLMSHLLHHTVQSPSSIPFSILPLTLLSALRNIYSTAMPSCPVFDAVHTKIERENMKKGAARQVNDIMKGEERREREKQIRREWLNEKEKVNEEIERSWK